LLFFLSHVQAAVDGPDLSSDVRGLIGRQERYYAGDFFGLSGTVSAAGSTRTPWLALVTHMSGTLRSRYLAGTGQRSLVLRA